MSKIISLDDLEIEPLTEMCRDAYEETAWALENTLKKAIHFGRLLCIAKKKVPHGKWITWVAETFEDQVSLRNIQRFMQVAESNTTDPSLLEGAKNLDEAMGRIQMKKPVYNVAAHEPRDIAAEVAAECGVTQEQIIQDGIYAEAVDVVSKTDPDIRAKVRAGTVTQAKVIATAKLASTAMQQQATTANAEPATEKKAPTVIQIERTLMNMGKDRKRHGQLVQIINSAMRRLPDEDRGETLAKLQAEQSKASGRDLLDRFVDLKTHLRREMDALPDSDRQSMWQQLVEQMNTEYFNK